MSSKQKIIAVLRQNREHFKAAIADDRAFNDLCCRVADEIYKPSPFPMTAKHPVTKDRLITLFMLDGPPYVMSYQYRLKTCSSWQEDKAVIAEMIREGTVRQIDKTRTHLLFEYKPKQ